MIRSWLYRHSVTLTDADDLVQEVLAVVVRRFPDFKHNQRPGAFRTWLWTITVNCVRDFWKACRIRPATPGGDNLEEYLDQLADPTNPLSQAWDCEHDLHVTQRLLEMIKEQFTDTTWEAFQRVALKDIPAEQVAKELGITVNAVFIAKSRVMARLPRRSGGYSRSLIFGKSGAFLKGLSHRRHTTESRHADRE